MGRERGAGCESRRQVDGLCGPGGDVVEGCYDEDEGVAVVLVRDRGDVRSPGPALGGLDVELDLDDQDGNGIALLEQDYEISPELDGNELIEGRLFDGDVGVRGELDVKQVLHSLGGEGGPMAEKVDQGFVQSGDGHEVVPRNPAAVEGEVAERRFLRPASARAPPGAHAACQAWGSVRRVIWIGALRERWCPTPVTRPALWGGVARALAGLRRSYVCYSSFPLVGRSCGARCSVPRGAHALGGSALGILAGLAPGYWVSSSVRVGPVHRGLLCTGFAVGR
jgi:hypothetical protein